MSVNDKCNESKNSNKDKHKNTINGRSNDKLGRSFKNMRGFYWIVHKNSFDETILLQININSLPWKESMNSNNDFNIVLK